MKTARVFAVMLLLILSVACLFACDPSEHEGVAILSAATDAGCPVELQSCKITLDIADFPDSYNNWLTEYNSKITFNYQFYNPIDNDVTMPLHVPYGGVPSYDEYHRLDACDTVMTVDGEPIQGVAHCWYGSKYYDSQNDYIVPDFRLSDEYYNLNLDVYKYIYEIVPACSIPDNDYEVVAEYKLNPNDIVLCGQSIYKSYNFAGKTTVQVMISADNELVVYSFGKQVLGFEQGVTINEMWGGEIPGSGLQLVGETKMSFDEMAFEYYQDNSELNRTDWYNAVLTKMQSKGIDVCQSATQFDITDEVRKWYDYTVSIPAHGTVNHTVVMPLFPTIMYAYDPTVYRYNLSLDNLRSWQNIGAVEIVANTEYYAVKKTQKNIKMQGLKESNITMQFSTESNPRNSLSQDTTRMILLLSLPNAIGIVIVIVVVSVYVRKSKKKGK